MPANTFIATVLSVLHAELEPVFVEPTSDRTAKGGVEMDFRIKSDAPSWAKKWQIVYAGNTDVDNFVQYTVVQGDPKSSADCRWLLWEYC